MNRNKDILKNQLIEYIQNCDNISDLKNLVDFIKSKSTIQEPEAVYETSFDLNKELTKGLNDIKEGNVHSNQKALDIIDKLIQ